MVDLSLCVCVHSMCSRTEAASSHTCTTKGVSSYDKWVWPCISPLAQRKHSMLSDRCGL